MWVLLWLVAIALLDLLLIAHECGHYLVARACRIRVERFGIGFGPTIFERTSQATGTTLRIGLVPVGALVRIRGMDDAGSDPDDRHAFPSRPVWQRLATILAGPAASYLGVAAIAMALYTCHGIDVPRWYGVGSVVPGSAAADKLQPGDVIRAFDHAPLAIDIRPTLGERVNQGRGAPVTLAIERNGEPRDVVIEPKQTTDASGAPTWRLGVQLEARELTVSIGVVDAARRGLVYPAAQARVMATALYRIVVGSESADPGGPVRMVMEFSKAFQLGIGTAIQLVMLLGVYLGLFLALPIPSFDGGRLLRLLYRAVTRRRSISTP
jgi:regulator of sigma E protease